jgi:uncharacterized protein (TIGR03437 family)
MSNRILTRIVCQIAVASLLLPVVCMAQGYTVTTVVGTGTQGFSGDGGAAVGAQIGGVLSVGLDSAGNLYVPDQFNHRLRKVTTDGTISTVAGNGTAGFKGDGDTATNAEFTNPSYVVVDGSGNIFISDTSNAVVRKVSGGKISTFAGDNSQGAGYGGDGGAATSALLNNPSGLALDSAGNLYIADTTNNLIRKVTSAGVISRYAGVGSAADFGDGGLALNAALNNPSALAVDTGGNLFIADAGNFRIRKIATNGIITTVAGSGSGTGYAGDGGLATKARLSNVKGIAVDSAGNLYLADTSNSRIRKVTTDGVITTIAGNGRLSYGGDGGPANAAQFLFPSGVAVDPAGRVYVADTQNYRVRLLTPAAQTPSISSGGVVSASGFGGFTSIAPGSWIEIYGTNLATTTRQWRTSATSEQPSDFIGVNAPTSLDGTSVTVGGQAAFVEYISPGQVDAQVPSGIGTGPQQIIVTTAQGTASPYTITVNSTQPGLLAPASFKIGGTQYVVAQFTDGTYVLPPSAIDGVASRQAKPGETITIYGVGFGVVTPNIPAGQIVADSNTLTLPLQISFGSTLGTVSYSGLAPTLVGLYQFNVTVPNVGDSDSVPLTFTLGGAAGTQTLFTAVKH